MKNKIKAKTARRWLHRNSWNIAKMKAGVGCSEKSCFATRMALCQKIIGE